MGHHPTDRKLAAQVAKQLSQIPGVAGKCWTEEFPLGLLTFEALERMLRTCDGAVFIITLSDRGMPNENVMIEVGLVAGRMGRTRVALCTEPNVVLPSDLAAVSRIEKIVSSPHSAGDKKGARRKRTISPLAVERLRDWATVLPAMLQGAPCTQVMRGYSGHKSPLRIGS